MSLTISKKLAIAQLSLAILMFIASIIMWNSSARSHWWWWSNMHGIAFFFMVLVIAIIVLGIIQIVFGARESNGVGLAAGIVSILIFVPFTWIAILVLDIIVISRKQKHP